MALFQCTDTDLLLSGRLLGCSASNQEDDWRIIANLPPRRDEVAPIPEDIARELSKGLPPKQGGMRYVDREEAVRYIPERTEELANGELESEEEHAIIDKTARSSGKISPSAKHDEIVNVEEETLRRRHEAKDAVRQDHQALLKTFAQIDGELIKIGALADWC